MLVLSRRVGETIEIVHPDRPDEVLSITVVSDFQGKIRLGLVFPRDYAIWRTEMDPSKIDALIANSRASRNNSTPE